MFLISILNLTSCVCVMSHKYNCTTHGDMTKTNHASGHQLQLLSALGDEIIEWNGRSLHGRSAQEVNDIVTDLRNDAHQVELIVSRPVVLGSNRRGSGSNQQSSSSSFHPWRDSHSPARINIGRGITIHLIPLNLSVH